MTDGAPLDRVVFVESGEDERIVVEPIDGVEVARRMVHSVRHEWLDLWTAYLKWLYAFPDRPNPILETLEERLSDGLTGGACRATRGAAPPPVSAAHPGPRGSAHRSLLPGRRLGAVAHRFLAERAIADPPKVTSGGRIRTLTSPRPRSLDPVARRAGGHRCSPSWRRPCPAGPAATADGDRRAHRSGWRRQVDGRGQGHGDPPVPGPPDLHGRPSRSQLDDAADDPARDGHQARPWRLRRDDRLGRRAGRDAPPSRVRSPTSGRVCGWPTGSPRSGTARRSRRSTSGAVGSSCSTGTSSATTTPTTSRRRRVAGRCLRRIHGYNLRRLYPRPDLVILLDAPAEVFFARKGEGTLESIESRRQEYLAQRDDVPVVRRRRRAPADRGGRRGGPRRRSSRSSRADRPGRGPRRRPPEAAGEGLPTRAVDER